MCNYLITKFSLPLLYTWRRKWQPTLVPLPGESHGRRSLVGYIPRGRKELDTTERLHFTVYLGFPRGSVHKESTFNAESQVQSVAQEHPLEKEMATDSSICAWKIPWTEEPGGL